MTLKVRFAQLCICLHVKYAFNAINLGNMLAYAFIRKTGELYFYMFNAHLSLPNYDLGLKYMYMCIFKYRMGNLQNTEYLTILLLFLLCVTHGPPSIFKYILKYMYMYSLSML